MKHLIILIMLIFVFIGIFPAILSLKKLKSHKKNNQETEKDDVLNTNKECNKPRKESWLATYGLKRAKARKKLGF